MARCARRVQALVVSVRTLLLTHATHTRHLTRAPSAPPQGHPMKPHRVQMAHNLIVNYQLYKEMDVFVRRVGGGARHARSLARAHA